jgi:hypothetical protein
MVARSASPTVVLPGACADAIGGQAASNERRDDVHGDRV